MMRFFNKIFLLTIATALFSACSNDIEKEDEQGGTPVEVHFSFGTRATSGTGVAQDPDAQLEVERFNHYWVVFTDGSGKIVAIVKNDCQLTERDEFTVLLSPGAYKAYGFANIADSFLEGVGIAEGNSMPNLSGILFTPDNRFFGNTVTTLLPVETFQADYKNGGNTGIPMTSKNGIDVNITNAITVDKSIEVVRMFAKLEFVFSNETPNQITLLSQSVSNLSVNKSDSKGYLPLMNDDERTFDFLDQKPCKTLSHSYGTGLSLTSGQSGVSRAFYVLESKADEITNSFLLEFDIESESTDANDYKRFGLTDPNTLTAIRRNDWIRIPIVFADWQLRLEAFCYAPIGGYPETKIEELESNEFTVTFLGGGDFTIRPFIRKYSEQNGWFGIDNKTMIQGTPQITVEDPQGLFAQQPTLTSTGEIIGKMNPDASGKTATVTIKVTVKLATTPQLLTKVLTRKIFVVQK